MFNKPKRNFRSRKRDSESDEEDLSDDSQAKDATKSTTLTAAKSGQSLTKTAADKGKKNSSELKAVSSANSLLSFVNNDEGMLQIRNVDLVHWKTMRKDGSF